MTNRRQFGASALGWALSSVPLPLRAQSARRLPVVGVLNTTATGRGTGVGFLVQGLRELGYEEGQHFAFDLRTSKQDPAAFPALAADLVKRDVAVIAPQGPAAVKSALGATRGIPIVALDLESDPVQAGWAESLARPGGNLTGLFLDLPGLAGKWLDLLRSAAPDARRMGLLWDPTTGAAQRVAALAAAQRLGIDVQVLEVRDGAGTAAALETGRRAGIGALVILGSPEFSLPATAKFIAGFAARHRLAAISPFRVFSREGGLMSYGPTREHFEPRGGVLIGKILQGAKAGDLPIELPSKFELIVNLKAAKALGIVIPPSLLLRADEVIE